MDGSAELDLRTLLQIDSSASFYGAPADERESVRFRFKIVERLIFILALSPQILLDPQINRLCFIGAQGKQDIKTNLTY